MTVRSKDSTHSLTVEATPGMARVLGWDPPWIEVPYVEGETLEGLLKRLGFQVVDVRAILIEGKSRPLDHVPEPGARIKLTPALSGG